MNKGHKKSAGTTDADKYPGIAINVADSNKKTAELIKERTRTLNNNPRNNQD